MALILNRSNYHEIIIPVLALLPTLKLVFDEAILRELVDLGRSHVQQLFQTKHDEGDVRKNGNARREP